MDLIIRPYFATGTREWERAISCKTACIAAESKNTMANGLQQQFTGYRQAMR